jgi:hypothetical protein
MNFDSFRNSLMDITPPDGLNVYLLSLWHEAKGNWNEAHEIIQNVDDKNGSWIHAYLHRKEGDIWNADYWYRKAGRLRPSSSLQDEWKSITIELLENFHV